MTLHGQYRNILIVEDEPILAYSIEELLVEADFLIAGVAGTLGAALAMIESGVCDAAILDANLKGVSAAPAASALAARGIPYIILSGYSRDQQQAAFAGGLHLQKPCRPERLIQALRDIRSPERLPTD
jgi:CheY-like chemotaxis protein